MLSGTHRIDGHETFNGMLNGTLVIGTGACVTVAGMVNGDVVVERGAEAIVTGMVNGGIVDHGGTVRVTGMVSGRADPDQAAQPGRR